MARAITGRVHRQRAKTILKRTKGFRGARSKLFRTAKNAMIQALSYAYTGRKLKKRDFRSLWISRISAACRNQGMTYSSFINGLNKAGINMNRKVLSNLAITDVTAFNAIVEKAKAALK